MDRNSPKSSHHWLIWMVLGTDESNSKWHRRRNFRLSGDFSVKLRLAANFSVIVQPPSLKNSLPFQAARSFRGLFSQRSGETFFLAGSKLTKIVCFYVLFWSRLFYSLFKIILNYWLPLFVGELSLILIPGGSSPCSLSHFPPLSHFPKWEGADNKSSSNWNVGDISGSLFPSLTLQASQHSNGISCNFSFLIWEH